MIIKDACEMFKGVHCSVIPKTKKQKPTQVSNNRFVK